MFWLIDKLDGMLRTLSSFNTSYVLVDQMGLLASLIKQNSFNTSYVLVDLNTLAMMILILVCFNTSYVLVDPSSIHIFKLCHKVSIHPMFWLIDDHMFVEGPFGKFQYILCSG